MYFEIVSLKTCVGDWFLWGFLTSSFTSVEHEATLLMLLITLRLLYLDVTSPLRAKMPWCSMEKYHCLHHSSVFWMSKTDIHFWKVFLLTKIPLSTGKMRSGASGSVYAGHVVCKLTLSISIIEYNSFEWLTTFSKKIQRGLNIY